jgi:DNA-binding NarL/FixJ family response regulator
VKQRHKHPSAPSPQPPAGLRASTFRLRGQDVAVLSFPSDPPPLPAELSPAEREVMLLVLDGVSNAEIARRRGRSARTIANQIAACYKKLGVSSRLELAAKLGRAR